MTTEQIKQNANKAFKEGNYIDAFHILWKIGVGDFIAYSQKKDFSKKKTNWFTDKKSASIFWETFILNDTFFTKLLSSKEAILLLHNYYSKTNLFIKEFETKLAKNFPLLFIEAIKLNQTFFKPERIDFICNTIKLDDELAIHQDFWEYSYNQEIEIWNNIETSFNKIIKHSIDDILSNMVAYIETSNYNTNFEVINQVSLADSYSFFIEMLLKHPKTTIKNTNSEAFTTIFTKNIIGKTNQNLQANIKKCFTAINARNNIFSKIYDNYSFNKETNLKYIYEAIYLFEKPESYYRWTKDEYRYRIAEISSIGNGSTIVNNNIKKGIKIKSKHKKDKEDNLELAERLTGIINTLRFLKLETFKIKNKPFDIEKVIKPIYAFAYNRYIRYYKNIRGIKRTYPKKASSWIIAQAINVLNNKNTLQVPYVYLSEQEYHDLNLKSNVEIEVSKAILNLFTYQVNKKEFNRFNVNYDINAHPFIKIGTHIFSPALFFTNFVGLFNYINIILQNNNRSSASKIESLLSDIIKIHNFNVFIPTKKDVNQIDGDADIIIHDKETVLLLQLKRTKLRLNLKKQYEEYLSVDLKASNQLNKAEKFLKKQNSIFEIGNRKVKKWIVSNSFEKTNTTINNCLKVNYLDLVNFLMNEHGMTFKTLFDFISFNEQDVYFNSLAQEFQLPEILYKLEEMNNYITPLHSFDDKKMMQYSKDFSRGLDLYKKKKYNESIKNLNKCLKKEQNDPLVYEAIASCYVAKNNLAKAKRYFEKALVIMPNDPFISRNYYSLLFETGEINKSLNGYIDLIIKYPLIKELKGVFITLLHILETKFVESSITQKQLDLIIKRMGKIKHLLK